MRNYRILVGLAALATATAGTAADDPDLARNLAASCANCHGTNGVSQGGTDTLAGAPGDELARKLREYRAGTKPGTVMPQLAKGFTEPQLDLVAAWFAAQKRPQ